MRDRRAAPLPCDQTGRRREVSSRTVAADGNARRVQPQPGRLAEYPVQRIAEIFQRHRKPVLRRQPVIDRQHDALRRVGQRATRIVVNLERAEAPPAAVCINDRRLACRALRNDQWPIAPHANLPPVARRHREGLHTVDRFQRSMPALQCRIGRPPQRVQRRRRLDQGQLLQQRGNVGVDRHVQRLRSRNGSRWPMNASGASSMMK